MKFSSNKPYLLRGLYEWILDNQGTPHLVVNAEMLGVEVPREHVKDGEIVLNVSPGATHGLELDNDFICFSARFSGVVRHIQVPMNSILAIIARENGQGMVFPPEELKESESFEDPEHHELKEELSTSTDTNEPSSDDASSDAEPNKLKDKKTSASHLRVVK